MIRLNTTTRKLQIVLSSNVTTNQLPVTVSYSDKTSTSYIGAIQLSNTNNTTLVDILSAPAASTIRDVDYLSVVNRDTTTSTVTINYNDNGTSYQILSVTLDANDQLIYTHAGGWHTQDTSGKTKVTSTGGGGGSGTVTSINASGGSTGMSFSGGPVTTSGTLTLNGTLDADNGGTGQSVYTVGDILYANTTTTLSKLGVGSTNQVLTVIGGVPTWQTPGTGSGTVTSVAATAPAAGFTISGSPITTSGTFIFALADDLAAVEGLSTTGIATRTATSTWTTRTVTGTSNRVAVTNGSGVAGNPTIDIDAAYIGQTSITILGTIGTGTWQGTTITGGFGGTGQSSYTVGDILYASGSTTLSKLADVATGNALISGGVAVAPSWGKIGLTTHISGTLGIGNGGTGVATTPTNGQLLVGNGTNYTLATITAGTGISVTNGSGSITITNTGGGGGGTTFYNVLPADTTVATDTSYMVLSYFSLGGFILTVNGNFGVIG